MRQAHPDPLPLHARLAEFEILDIVAAGDFGILYRAHDHLLDREITLREYLPSGYAQRDADGSVAAASARDEELFGIGLRGFIDEARLLARLEHPALMKVYRYWEANGTAYMAMPFHAGITLEQALREGGIAHDEAGIALLLGEALDALDMLHAEDRVHGGIGPDAILLRPDGRALLLDIGAARKTLADLALTPTAMLKSGYAALEQYEVIPGLKPGAWTDVYAMAAIAYRLVTGMPPPDAEVRSEHDAMLPAVELGKGRYRDAFLAAIDAALALMPQERTATAAALRDALGIAPAGPMVRVHAPAMPPVPPAPDDFPAIAAAPAAAESEPRMQHARPAPLAAAASAPFAAPPSARFEDAPRADAVMVGRERAPASARRRRIPEAVFVVFIAAALYAGFRSLANLAPHEAGDARPPLVAANVPPAAPAAPATAPVPAMPSTNAATGQAPNAATSAGTQANATNTAKAADAAPPTVASAAPAAPATPAAASAAPAAPVTHAAAPAVPANSAQANIQAKATPPAQASAAPAASLFPAPQAKSALTAAEATQRAAQRREETDWLSAQSIDTLGAYESFLAAYPDSSHASAARVLLARLRWEQRQAETARAQAAAPASPARAPQSAEVREAVPRAAPTRASQAPLIQDRIALARPPEAATVAPVTQQQQPAETAQIEGGTIRLHGQTMHGDFKPDPVTGAVSGHGRIAWDNGDRFEGTLVRGVKEGRGEFVWANGQRYRGDWAGGLPNGRGSIQFPNGNRYEGDMRNGAPNGVGTIYFANGNRYTGEVRDGLPNGRGTNRFVNGDSYSGAWRMGRSDGHGRYTWANGDVWEGEFRDGAKTANGRMLVAARGRDAAGSVSGASSSGSASAASAADADDPFLK